VVAGAVLCMVWWPLWCRGGPCSAMQCRGGLCSAMHGMVTLAVLCGAMEASVVPCMAWWPVLCGGVVAGVVPW